MAYVKPGGRSSIQVSWRGPLPGSPVIGRCISTLALSVLLALPAVADFKAGMEAYERGDFERALREWRPAAEEGMPEAQFNLALIYYHGKGIPVDLEQAQQWYLRAAEQNYVPATSNQK